MSFEDYLFVMFGVAGAIALLRLIVGTKEESKKPIKYHDDGRR